MSSLEFQKLGALSRSPYQKDYSVLGSTLGPPILGNYHNAWTIWDGTAVDGANPAKPSARSAQGIPGSPDVLGSFRMDAMHASRLWVQAVNKCLPGPSKCPQ